MARGVNRVILLGNLGKDPETKTFANGGSVTNATLATSESWKGKDGQPQEHTEWHNLSFNGKLGEIVERYLTKGSKVYVEGSIRTRKYQDKEGREARFTEIRVNEMQMLDGKRDDDDSGRAPARREPQRDSRRTAAPANTGFDGPDDDIPF